MVAEVGSPVVASMTRCCGSARTSRAWAATGVLRSDPGAGWPPCDREQGQWWGPPDRGEPGRGQERLGGLVVDHGDMGDPEPGQFVGRRLGRLFGQVVAR